jgi:hypothetical protein
MQLLVMMNGTRLRALLDFGSTHNFVDIMAAQRVGIILQLTVGLPVAVMNGDRVTSPGCCRGLRIGVGTESFTIDCYGLEVASYEMVLGVQWIESLGPILWDFGRCTMTFIRNGHCVLWIATDVSPAPPHLLTTTNDLMDDLLVQFKPLSVSPVGLPPTRGHCHKIQLLPSIEPVAVKPYRYTHHQKVELERQCCEMLTQGIIHPSTSVFLASVLLVKKADDSWRLCVDYRALNSQTIKDKFAILAVEELLDELHGVAFFSKLNLRSSYHQVLMHVDDINKTAFRTH